MGKGWTFDPGESIYLLTGRGQDVFIADPPGGGRPQFHFYWNREAMVSASPGQRWHHQLLVYGPVGMKQDLSLSSRAEDAVRDALREHLAGGAADA